MFEKLSLAIVGIGAWTDAESTVRPAMAPEMASRLDAAGATADVCAIVFDAQGREIADGGLADRSIAISSRQLRAVPEVIAVAGGARKAAAILAVLRSGLIHRLITDVEAAERLLSA